MSRAASAFGVASCFAIVACLGLCAGHIPTARAQGAGVAISFRNDLNIALVVQGHSMVNGMKKAGMVLVIQPGKTAAENNIPMGTTRVYMIADANAPGRPFIQNLPVQVGAQDLNLAIRGMPPGKVFLQQVP